MTQKDRTEHTGDGSELRLRAAVEAIRELRSFADELDRDLDDVGTPNWSPSYAAGLRAVALLVADLEGEGCRLRELLQQASMFIPLGSQHALYDEIRAAL